jgi:hypothetical protein
VHLFGALQGVVHLLGAPQCLPGVAPGPSKLNPGSPGRVFPVESMPTRRRPRRPATWCKSCIDPPTDRTSKDSAYQHRRHRFKAHFHQPPPFHATAVTLSSSSGDRLSRIGPPSPGSGCAHEKQIEFEMSIPTTRQSHRSHVMRFSKAQPRAVSKVTIAARLHSAQWRPGVVRCSSAQFADPHCRAT